MRIRTAQIMQGRKLFDGIDVTVMSGSELFSPSNNMVREFKAGRLSEEEFKRRYEIKMLHSFIENRDVWMELFAEESVTLMCYCNIGEFCHRHLLADIMKELGEAEGFDIEVEGEI